MIAEMSIKSILYIARGPLYGPILSIVTFNYNNAIIVESVKASDKTKILVSPVGLAQLLMFSDKTKTLASPIGMAK